MLGANIQKPPSVLHLAELYMWTLA